MSLRNITISIQHFMKKIVVFLAVIIFQFLNGQEKKWDQLLVAFPITDYIIDSDGVILVQIHVTDENVKKIIKEGQLAVLEPLGNVFNENTKGYYKCALIKGDYFYFGCSKNDKKSFFKDPTEKDLLYLFVDKPKNYYLDGIVYFSLVMNSIKLFNIYDEPLYNHQELITKLTIEKEKEILKKCVEDIQLTAQLMEKEESGMEQNILIDEGPYKGIRLFDAMKKAKEKDVQDFFSYIKVRPQKYAGNEYRISEIYATWIAAGCPVPVKK